MKSQLEDARRSITEARLRIHEASARSDELVQEKTRSTLQHKELLSNIRDRHQALVEAQIRLIEAKSDVQALEERNLDIKRRLDNEQMEIRAAKEEADQLKEEAQLARETVSEAVADDPDRLPYLNELASGKTVEELDNEIGAEQSKLEYVHAVDPAVLRQFQKRAQEILNLTQQKEEMTAKFESLSRKTEELRQKWEPRVDALITKINDAFAYNFEQINCAGQVDIYKDEEDFDQWAIEIKVKFRFVPPFHPPSVYFPIHTKSLTYLPTYLSNKYPLVKNFPLRQAQQTKRDAPTAQPAPAVGRGAGRVDHLLPHGAAVDGAGAVPRRRRDQPGHGPAQRAHGARAHGGDRLPRAHVAVLPHHAQAAHGPPLRRAHARPLHRLGRAHAPRGPTARLCEASPHTEGYWGRCVGGCLSVQSSLV